MRRDSRSRSPPKRDSRSESPPRLGKHDRKELRRRQREEIARKAKEKAALKANETPEEKVARRLAKKAAKKSKLEAEKKAKEDAFAGYTNNDNPFGDKNLGATFKWHKKEENLKEQGITLAMQEDRARRLQEENRIELEKVKEARAQRERDMEEKEKEKEAEQRAKEDEMHAAWMGQEEDFHLEQARRRSKIRVKDGRAKPIDILATYIQNAADPAHTEMDMQEPYAIFIGLDMSDVQDLYEDIKVYQHMDKDTFPEFWADMKLIAEYELDKKKRQAAKADKRLNPAQKRALDTGIDPATLQRISDSLRNKPHEELLNLKTKEIPAKLEKGVELFFWERMVIEVELALAKCRLREMHQKTLEDKLDALKAKKIAEEDFPSDGEGSGSDDDDIVLDEDEFLAILEEEDEEDDGTGGIRVKSHDIEPPLEPFDAAAEAEGGIQLLDPAEDTARLAAHRKEVLTRKSNYAAKNRKGKFQLRGPRPHISGPGRNASTSDKGSRLKNMTGAAISPEERAFLAKQASEKLAADESQFSEEIDPGITAKMHLWREKYKPRKPRYFNRVHTGFEWNKYNQTHYDSDNPPPKIVQGYKFHLFYPDLIDKEHTPTFSIKSIPEEPGMAILRFTAGPPYEDVAFRVVDRPWEQAYRRGFRSEFRNDVMQLWFHFRRDRYRR